MSHCHIIHNNSRLNCFVIFPLFHYHPLRLIIMSDEWDAKLVIGHKRSTPKVAKKDSDLNG
jgi:hypothetical protein